MHLIIFTACPPFPIDSGSGTICYGCLDDPRVSLLGRLGLFCSGVGGCWT